jgi:CubicO group peptidase (beta-lactamase class C family)
MAKEWLGRGIPGLAIAVAVRGHIVYSEAFGYADLEQHVPVRRNTRFRVGSVSKPMTAVALVQLVEAGKIELDAPVQNYVPSFPVKPEGTITARLLAGHLSGIRNYQDDEFYIQKHYASVIDGLEIFKNDPLTSAPGEKYNYSSFDFDLLSAVIQSASGENFVDYVQKRLFTPLNLRDSCADDNARIIDHRARFYEPQKDGPLNNARYVDNSYKWAAGGFLSTAEDLVRFGSALLQPGFLKAESLALMFTSQKTKAGEETGYGMGWNVHRSQSGRRVYEHVGGAAGGSASLIVYPDSRLVVALVANYPLGTWKNEEVEKVGEAFVKR